MLLAAKYHVPLLPFLLRTNGVDGSMQADGIDATDQGNAQVARNFFPGRAPAEEVVSRAPSTENHDGLKERSGHAATMATRSR